MFPESNLQNDGEVRMGSFDSSYAEDTVTQYPSSDNSQWTTRDNSRCATTLNGSSDSINSSDESFVIVPETPSPLIAKNKRRICDSDSSNSPKRPCWSAAAEDEDATVLSDATAATFDSTDIDFREISLSEDMNDRLCQDSSSSSNRNGGTSASTEDEEVVVRPRNSRRSPGRTVLLSSDDSDLDMMRSQKSSESSGSASQSGSGALPQGCRSRPSTRNFPRASSSSGEHSSGTAFRGRRCRQRSFHVKKHARMLDEESSSCSSQTDTQLLTLQQDLGSPHTPRRSRIFSSRSYHHVSPRTRLEERTTNQGMHAYASPSNNVFSGSPTFRRDDPGRRPLTRSSHSSQGRRVVQPSAPPSQENFSNYIRTMPDIFDAGSDESTEFFTANSSHSENDKRRRRVSGSPAARGRRKVTDLSPRGSSRIRRRRPRIPVAHVQVPADNSDDDVGIVYTGAEVFTPTTYHPSTGRRQRRGMRSRRRHVSSERDISSPDPVQQVRQVEEDERMARMLQAQFDSENVPVHDVSIALDNEFSESSTTSSETSSFSNGSSASSSRGEDNVAPGYNRRMHRNPRRRNAAQRNWQNPRTRAGHVYPLLNLLALGTWSSGSEDYDYEALWDLVQVVGDVVPRGLMPQQLSRLPTRNYGDGEAKVKECQVCLSEFEKQDLLRILPCFHEFHAACIDKWLPMNRTCPVCRAEVEVD